MLIFAIDDEPKMLRSLHAAIAEAMPGSTVNDYTGAKGALEALENHALKPDVVFMDIEMPGMSGLDLAVRIKEIHPDARLIFVTAYSEYALDAYKRHVNGYLLKPVDVAMVREELNALDLIREETVDDNRLSVRCFGYFDIFHKGEPVVFARKKSKELFAYLIDRKGGVCTSSEIASVLWEDEPDANVTKHRLRTVISDLRATLKSIGCEGVLIRENRQLAIRVDRVDCDYYRMLDGDMAALNAYHGDYMIQYSWAELTTAALHFHTN